MLSSSSISRPLLDAVVWHAIASSLMEQVVDATGQSTQDISVLVDGRSTDPSLEHAEIILRICISQLATLMSRQGSSTTKGLFTADHGSETGPATTYRRDCAQHVSPERVLERLRLPQMPTLVLGRYASLKILRCLVLRYFQSQP